MSINLLPDECLLNIFKSIHDVHTLFRCLGVSRRWNRIVSDRLAIAERLLDKWVIRGGSIIDDDYLYYSVRVRPLVAEILSKILLKSPKMKVVSIGYENEVDKYTWRDPGWLQKSIDCLFRLGSLEGLMISNVQPVVIETIPPFLKSFYCEDFCILKGYYPQVKHLIVDEESFVHSIDQFPGIEWLTLRIFEDHHEWFERARINQHLFKNLKMLEIDTAWDLYYSSEENLAIRFIDFCPQLESAHIKIAIDQKVPDDNFRHMNLTNLVISFVNFEQIELYRFNLIKILKRFPNIKHFAIRCFVDLPNNYPIGSDDGYADSASESEDTDDVESGFIDDVAEVSESEEAAEVREVAEVEEVMEVVEVVEVADVVEAVEVAQAVHVAKALENEEKNWRRKLNITLPLTIVNYMQNLVLLDMRDIPYVDASSAAFVRCHFRKSNRLNGKLYYNSFLCNGKIKRDWPQLFDEQRDSSAYKFMSRYFLRDYPKRHLIRVNEVENGHNLPEDILSRLIRQFLNNAEYCAHN